MIRFRMLRTDSNHNNFHPGAKSERNRKASNQAWKEPKKISFNTLAKTIAEHFSFMYNSEYFSDVELNAYGLGYNGRRA